MFLLKLAGNHNHANEDAGSFLMGNSRACGHSPTSNSFISGHEFQSCHKAPQCCWAFSPWVHPPASNPTHSLSSLSPRICSCSS